MREMLIVILSSRCIGYDVVYNHNIGTIDESSHYYNRGSIIYSIKVNFKIVFRLTNDTI